MTRIDYTDSPAYQHKPGTVEPVCDECQQRNGAVVAFGHGTRVVPGVCRDCIKKALDLLGGPDAPASAA